MEKTIQIDGQDVKFKSSAAFLYKYKAQFGRDAIHDILKLEKAYDTETEKLTNVEVLDFNIFYNLVWVLAKNGNPDISDPEKWLDKFGEFPLDEIIPEVMEMILLCMTSSKKKGLRQATLNK